MVDLDRHAVVADLRVGERLRVRVDRRGHHIGLAQPAQHVQGIAPRELGRNLGVEGRLVFQAACDRRKARVRHQVGAVQRAADVVEELVVERGDLHVAPVPAAERAVRRIERAGVADARLHVVGEEELADLCRLDVNQPIDQTHLDLLADALLLARPQAQHGGERDQVGASRVGNRRTGFERSAVTFAGDAHETRQRLGERVDAGPARVRPILAEGADRDADDRCVVGARFLVAHAELGLGLRA